MIFLDSRYSDGKLIKHHDSRTNSYQLSVFRKWPNVKTSFFLYTWDDTDRMDIVAKKFLGNSNYWWQIMDINPEIMNPLSIAAGTKIRIPGA